MADSNPDAPRPNDLPSAGLSLPRLLTAEELAEALRVRKDRVYELARLKVIPCVHYKRQVRFVESEIAEWLRRGGAQ